MQIFRVILYENPLPQGATSLSRKNMKNKIINNFLRNYLYFKKLVHKFAAEVDESTLNSLINANCLLTLSCSFKRLP